MNETNPEVKQNTDDVAAGASPTSQAFDTKEDNGFSFDEVIFGDGSGTTERGTPVPEAQPQQPEGSQGSAPVEGQPEQPYEAKNDDKRFEYWQSKASKLENQLKEAQPLVDYVKKNPEIIQQQTAQPEQPAAEEFPPPPTKPKRPHNYNRELAYTDPSSESARYENEIEEWRDGMDEYNQLKVQYETALVREKMEEMETQRLAQAEHMRARNANQQKMQDINQHVQAEYGMTSEESVKFIKDMSDPSSVSMDNLVTLWRMNNGKSAAPQPSSPDLAGEEPRQRGNPSDAFQQTQRAQQVPPPMGVVSGQGSSNPDDGKTDGEKFMAALISSRDKNQAF